MTKKFWILLVSILLAVAVFISPLSPVAVQDYSVGEILDPSGNPFAHTFSDTKDIRTATYVVALSDSEHKYMADYRCDSTDDHLTIQAALDALPDTGGEVFVLDGTANIEASLVLDSYQTLRGCGRNTILTTTTADVDIVTATGGDGSEKVGILIADLCIDGNAGGAANDIGILWTYVDHSKIRSIWTQDNGEEGIKLDYCGFNELTGNTCQGNLYGIRLSSSNNNTITGNTCWGNDSCGIYLLSSSNHNIITNNTCRNNAQCGIWLVYSNDNIVTGNTCLVNAQQADNTYDNIRLSASDYNLIAANLCRAPTIGTTLTVGEPIAETEIAVTNTTGFEVGMGVVIDLGGVNVEYHRIVAITAGAPGVITIDAGLTNAQGAAETIDVPEAQYGVNVSNNTCDKNIVQGNDLHHAGKTANFNDVGTCTTVQDDNRELDNAFQVRHMVYVKNVSGGNRVAGNVMSYSAVGAADMAITDPAGVGEDQVWGMLAENIDNNAYGYMLVKGGTAILDATNAGGAIAIGDFLCSEAGNRARLAAAGDMAFAIALEAGDAVDLELDALLIVPRKI